MRKNINLQSANSSKFHGGAGTAANSNNQLNGGLTTSAGFISNPSIVYNQKSKPSTNTHEKLSVLSEGQRNMLQYMGSGSDAATAGDVGPNGTSLQTQGLNQRPKTAGNAVVKGSTLIQVQSNEHPLS